MNKAKNTKNNMKKQICSLTLASMMLAGTCSSAYAAPISKLPKVSDNSLVIGKHLFELDKANKSQYNLNALVEASKTVDENNGVYYKHNGKWYTGKDIENFDSLKNAKGMDTISNDILKINGNKAEEQIKPEEPAKPEQPVEPEQPSKPEEGNKDKNRVYKDGVYEGEADGFKSTIKVKVTIKDDKMESIDIVEANDTSSYFKKAKAIVEKILNKQSEEVDNVSGATFSSKGIKKAVKNALEKAKVSQNNNGNTEKPEEPVKPEDNNKKDNYKDGVYEGEGQGFQSTIKVKVTIKDGKMNNIDIVDAHDTPTFFNKAKSIIGKILNKQSEEVDNISGATISSKGIKEAVKNALEKAKGPEINKHYPITISNYTQEGKENKVTFDKKPTRVITANQCATELLLTLGLEDYMVGTSYMDDSILPSLKEKYEKIPVLAKKYPSPEIAEKQNPDFIMGFNSAFFGYGLGFPQNWNKKGVKTFIHRNTVQKQTIENAYKDIEDIGKIFDIEDRAESLIKSMKDTISDVEDRVKKADEKVRVMAIEVEREDEYYSYGKNNLVNDMIEKAGGENIGDGETWDGNSIASENPDVIIFITYENQNGDNKETEKLTKNSDLEDVNAIKNNKIINTSLAETYPGGVRVASTIKKFAECFYPEVFKNNESEIVNNNENKDNSKDNIKKTDFKLDWYQDGDYSHDKDGENESIEQFIVAFNKPINLKKGALKIIVPDKTKEDSYGANKIGEIEVKMDGTSKEKALANVKGGERVTCFIRPDDASESNNRFVLELTQDWDCILNTEKTGVHYYDDNIKGLRLIGEGLEDENGNPIEDSKGTGKITADRDIELYKDDSKPSVVAQKLIYDKIGINGVQKAGSLGVVFNEPVQLYTKEMVDDGFIPPVIYKDHNPLTPSPSQIGTYENFLPEFKAQFEKVDDKGDTLKDENGNPIVVEGKYDLMADILPSNTSANALQQAISIKMSEISCKFDLDPENSGINRFRDYGLFYINPETSLSEGKWRLVLSKVSDDAGNEMDEYKSQAFEIKPLFSIESLTKDGIKIKFIEPFSKNDITEDGITLVVTKYGEIVNSAYSQDIKEGQTEAEAKFKEPITDELEGEYFINNISYIVNK